MRKYPTYKLSGVDWLGEIPSDWQCMKIKRLTVVKRGASPRPIDDSKYFDMNGEFAWVRIADVTASERYLEYTTQRLSKLGSSLSVKRYPGDLFLSIAATVGKPIIAKVKCCIHDGFVWFPYLKINPEFFYYLFSTGLPYQGLGKMGTQLNLNTDTVGDINLPIPRDEEISSIVHFLDYKTGQMDSFIANRQKQIELLKEQKTGILNNAVSNGINPKAKMKSSGIPWIGDIPYNWIVIRLKFIIKTMASGVSVNSTDEPAEANEYGILKTSSVYTGEFNPNENKKILETEYVRMACPVKANTIIISRMNTPELVGANGFVDKDYERLFLPDRLWQTVFFKKAQIVPKWLSYFLSSNRFRTLLSSLATGTSASMKNITQDDVLGSYICLPPIEEQHAMVEFLKEEILKIDTLISKYQKQIDLMQEYRTALISQAVTGKIDVREYV